MIKDTTVIICCAGKGTRLGLGLPKCLVSIDGKPLIIHQLELLQDCDDIRIVLGYKAESVIETVDKYGFNAKYIINEEYETTAAGASASLALDNARKYVVIIVGDLFVNKEEMNKVLNYNGQCICCSIPNTDYPILLSMDEKGNVVQISKKNGDYEWIGFVKIRSDLLSPSKGPIYQMIEQLLPIKAILIESREIDTTNDYSRALEYLGIK